MIKDKRLKIKEKGFTLVEILVTIAIIALVGVVAVPNLRRLNEDQSLEGASSRLIGVLSEAQTSAQSSIQCPSGKQSADWSVVFEVSAQKYYLQANCLNSDGTKVLENKPDIGVTGSVILDSTSCAGNKVTFSKNTVLAACGVVFKNTRAASVCQEVLINPGGTFTKRTC